MDAAVALPVPGEDAAPAVHIGWGHIQQDGTLAGLKTALDQWAPNVESSAEDLTTRQAAQEAEVIALRARINDLEVRTGAAVTEGATQVGATANAVMQTAEYVRGLERAAAAATNNIRADLMQVVSDAQDKFNQQAVTEGQVRERIELLGNVAQSMATEIEKKFQE